jgi:hypothetical protein
LFFEISSFGRAPTLTLQDDSLIALTQLNLTTVQRAIAAEFKTDLLCIRCVPVCASDVAVTRSSPQKPTACFEIDLEKSRAQVLPYFPLNFFFRDRFSVRRADF